MRIERTRAPGTTTVFGVSVERDELLRLVQDLPEDQVPQALAEVRRHLRPVADRPWPPAFFGIAPGTGERIADRADRQLSAGFGR